MAPANRAAWITAERAVPLEVKESEYVAPTDNEIVVKVHAIALNPVDFARQLMGAKLFPWTKYPTVFGTDVAGEVVEVGAKATNRYKVGDRVIGLGNGLETSRPADGAFQEYVVLREDLTSLIPDNLEYEQASVIPLGLATAAAGLFQADQLALDLPTAPARPPKGETVLIWSGASSVGSNAVQLAVAAGYEVISTSSPKNFDYVKKLGASQVFDYNSPSVVADIVAAFNGKKSAGAYAIGFTAAQPVIDIVSQLTNGPKHVAVSNQPPAELPEGVTAKMAFVGGLKATPVGPAIFNEFVPKGLADGTFVAAPPPKVVGQGLESIQGGLDTLRAGGLSATKLVIKL
ncbi:oxidoreductase, Zinc-binding alcohol dehydrogenase [Talaromyces atroroseus]|uniref:Oxidoreductase, Zinc-binding alcohol dehydrogenase n=1 Tax=Talaromyces atroroseus TaxID=1441469 RepID=A0A225ADC3_TALAT|nr:oxidoreductase, Zinc-binding alcohol dehydrogenase [Talaromyces atroroseus]OKL58420.1 oxidoreductase, Zinc-binding alcohol dehydrogenase [Talaromyces atroroseus]